MSRDSRLGLFQGFGVEIEYMIVDRDTLQIKPIADEVLKAEAGRSTSDVDRGALAWSNELVLHVLELKTNGPAASLFSLPLLFHTEVVRVNQLLEPFNAMLLPTGAHPFMNPYQETKLWPHDDASEIYQAYNKIFNCQGHGWSNLQSTHLNLPFASDEEFGRLHAAIRLVLPLIPAISAASPVLEGQLSGLLDTRLEVYRKNQQQIPLIAGDVIPEAVFTEEAYRNQIFQPMFQAIAPYDPQGMLQEEFLNSRGAIARFSRGAIEIRIIDNQECPLADMAVITLVTELIKKLVQEEWGSYKAQQQIETSALASVFLPSLKNGAETEIQHPAYLQALGIQAKAISLREIWHQLWQQIKASQVFAPAISHSVEIMLTHGCVAQRIIKALGVAPSEGKIKKVYHQLAKCLAQNTLFIPQEY